MAYKPKILVADDNRNPVAYLSLLLRKMDCSKIVIAESGMAALRLLEMWRPEVVILDINMPEMDGLETLRRMREKKELSDIPVILITSEKDGESFDACKSLGCAGYLVKPFSMSALHDILQQCVTRSGSSRRHHLRTQFDGKVPVRHGRKTREFQAVTLSEGGIFLKTKDPLPVGSEVKVELPVKGGKNIVLAGDVIYHMEMSNESATPPGMAIKFNWVRKKDSERLSAFVTGLITGLPRDKEKDRALAF